MGQGIFKNALVLILLACLSLCLLALVGCGGDGDEASSTTSGDETTTSGEPMGETAALTTPTGEEISGVGNENAVDMVDAPSEEALGGMPIYPGADFEEGRAEIIDTQFTARVILNTEDGFYEVFDWYKDELGKEDYLDETHEGDEKTAFTIGTEPDDYTTIHISADYGESIYEGKTTLEIFRVYRENQL
jgi:hypothetical protein